MYNLKDDLLGSVNDIAEYVNKTPRQVYYLLERGILPGFKQGGRWNLRKSTHIAHIEKLEAATIRGSSDAAAS